MSIESPEEFAARLKDECEDGIRYEEQFEPDLAVPLIKERDLANKLAVYDYLISFAVDGTVLLRELQKLRSDLATTGVKK